MAQVKFAVIVGEEVAGTIVFDSSSGSESAQRFIAAYRSNPTIVETSDENVMFGWTWDGTNFVAPSTE